MISSWPTVRKSGFDSLLASISCWIVTPNFSAIPPRVSPGAPTYFCPVVGAADDGAAEGGAALAEGGADGALLDGAADVLGRADAEADGAVLGVAERGAVGVPLTPVGVTVAESREQAPRSSAPPSRLATRLSRKR